MIISNLVEYGYETDEIDEIILLINNNTFNISEIEFETIGKVTKSEVITFHMNGYCCDIDPKQRYFYGVVIDKDVDSFIKSNKYTINNQINKYFSSKIPEYVLYETNCRCGST